MFRNRQEAGRKLGEALRAEALADPVVIALPRGGVPVGAEIARVLGAPLDIVMVRKLGTPGQPELAMGAVAKAEATDVVINHDVVDLLRLSQAAIERAKRQELEVIAGREARYMAGRQHCPLRGRTAIVVDDGIATGATTRAALRAVRRAGPARIVLAVPVAPPDAVRRLAVEADRVIALEQPAGMGAIGLFYIDFRQTTDSEVVAALDELADATPDQG